MMIILKLKRVLIFMFLIGVSITLNSQRLTVAQYVDKYKFIAIQEMLDYKIPASITLAQGILESANGNSDLATQGNNHFGIKCHTDWKGKTMYKDDDAKNECFRVYESPEQSFRDHSLFLTTRKRYAFLFDYGTTDYKAWAKGLKEAGYATNPNYPDMLVKIIEENNLNRFDRYDNKDFGKLMKDEHVVYKRVVVDSDTIIVFNIDTVAEPSDVVFNSPGRKVLVNNRVKYIVVKPGDDMEKIAKETNTFLWELYKYNEVPDTYVPKPGDRIYLQPKRSKAESKFYIVKDGDSVWSISQQFAMKTKWLYKRNKLQPGTMPAVGTKLSLRKTIK